MNMPLDTETKAALISAGWVPPRPDYERWRKALSAFYAARDAHSLAESVLTSPLDRHDREIIAGIAAAVVFAPAPVAMTEEQQGLRVV